MHRMGERIKKRREFLNIHLGEFASQIGVSSSLLSQIENGKAFPSVFTLKKIADGLKTTVGELIGENETFAQNPLVRWKDKKFVKKNGAGAALYLLSEYSPLKQMETYLLVLDKDGGTDEMMESHPGQEFFHVLKGEVCLTLNGAKHGLTKGDSLYYNSGQLHTVVNTGKGAAEALWIVTPPKM